MNIEDLKRGFETNGRDLLKRAVEDTKQNGAFRLSIPYADAITLQKLQELAPQIDKMLQDCETSTAVLNKLFDVLGAIPGLDPDAVKDYALIYSYRTDLLPDADCEMLISEKGKSTLAENEIAVEEIRELIRREARDAYYMRAMVFFINHLKDDIHEIH